MSADLIERARFGDAAGDRVSAITRFESAVLSRFGLPRTLPVVP